MKSILLFLCFAISNETFAQKTLTERNFEGQKYLYNKGWHIIPSGSQAWTNFKHAGLEPSGKAMARAIKNIADSPYRMKELKDYFSAAGKTDQKISSFADDTAKKIELLSQKLDDFGTKFSTQLVTQMRDAFVLGYIHFEVRTTKESKRLKSFFTNYLTDYQDLTSNSNKDYAVIKKKFLKDAETDWKKHFSYAEKSFNEQYEKSGTRSNSLTALWDIILGHGKAIYHAVLAPLTKETTSAAKKSVIYITKGFYDVVVAGTSIVYSTGLNFYSAGSYGVKLVSPSLEAGLLGAMSVVSYLATKGSKYILQGSGVISKYAVKASGKVIAGSQLVGEAAIDGAKSAIYTTAQLGVGGGEAVIETSSSALMLGYTALTQIPVHILLGAANSTIFLVWDGPRLIIAKVSGDDLRTLPSGAVLDKKELEQKGYKFEELDMNEDTKKKVIKSIR